MKKTLSLLLLSALIAPLPAQAANPQDVVTDHSGGVVRSSLTGSCVRTKWMAAGDPCAPREAVAVATTTARSARTLAGDERTVYFEFDKSRLTPQEVQKLDRLAEILKSDRQVQSAKIAGYADRMGSEKYNDNLSQKRAKAVSDYLIARGFVNSSVAETRWFGENAPSTDCSAQKKRRDLIDCLQPDRKVEVDIQYMPEAWPQASR